MNVADTRPRFRFSPAPTGFLHVGSARSALFNWLAARHYGGEVLLRVEDTNQALYREEYLDAMRRTLEWLGLGFDGETVFQSRRAERYAEVTDDLLARGHAYRCECTRDDVEARTGDANRGYDGHCRDLELPPGPGRMVRFRVPREGHTAFDDIVRGTVTTENASLEDFPIQRSDGTATFYLPNAVDDIDMGISHVVRGEDLVNVTPRVLLIREAMGNHERPVFAHLPLIVNAQRKKLSKRRDDVSVESYHERGFLPEAMRNYLAVLGWGPPDGVEIRPIEEIVELFRLEDVVSSSAFFDVQKLEHFNAEYIKQLAPRDFVERARPWLPPGSDEATVEKLAPELQTRVKVLHEIAPMVDFLFATPQMDDRAWNDVMVNGPAAREILVDALGAFTTCDWVAPVLQETTMAIGERHGVNRKRSQAPVRVAVTGRTVGPPLFESLVLLGRDETVARLRAATERLG